MLLSKVATKQVARTLVRNYSAGGPNPYVPDYKAAEKAYTIFKYISFGICFPLTAAFGAYCYMTHEHPKRPEFIPYEHMYIMTKPFPWGDGKRGLWFNPQVNATVDGYVEDEHPHH